MQAAEAYQLPLHLVRGRAAGCAALAISPRRAVQPKVVGGESTGHSSRLIPGSSLATGAPLGAAARDIILVMRASPLSFRIASWMA